jgi:alpha-L-fucosidase
MRAQRIYNDRRWPNPVVLKITHAQPALVPPRISMVAARWDRTGNGAVFEADLLSLGEAPKVNVGFQHRRRKQTEALYEESDPWKDTEFVTRTSPGRFTVRLGAVAAAQSYEVRAVVRHPRITMYSQEVTLEAQQ